MAPMLGAGVIILIVVWVISILLCLMFVRFEGPASYAGIAIIVVAIIVTLALWMYPREEPSDVTPAAYDSTSVLRTAVVAVLGVMLLAGAVVVTALHAFEQHRATAIKPWTC